MKRLYTLALAWMMTASLSAEEGKFLNPFTDICWKCLFPIHLGGVNVTPETQNLQEAQKLLKAGGLNSDLLKLKESKNPIFCTCAGMPPKVGITLSFWEPLALIDVTRTPWKSIALGGLKLAPSGTRGHGMISNELDTNRHSFYHVHYYKFPVLSLLELIPGFSCTEKGASLDLAFISELDPSWIDDSWKNLLTPEVFLLASPLAQAACLADCAAASLGYPLDKLYWCAGCMGSIYPMMGHVMYHIGAIQASHLLVQRTLAKMHSLGLMSGVQEGNFCSKKRYLRIKKSLYKTQLTHPLPQTQGPCIPLGKSDVLWGAGKSYPRGGEDFVYLVWTKKHCCLDAVQTTTAGALKQ